MSDTTPADHAPGQAEQHAWLGLGGNIGDVSATMTEALRRLEAGGARLVRRSADYETPPWGKLDQPPFLNACAEVATRLSPLELLRLCLAVETSLGRIREVKWGPRVIDIDLLVYDGAVLSTPELTLPHPFIAERAFVLLPLAEIAPDLALAGGRAADLAARIDAAGIIRRG